MSQRPEFFSFNGSGAVRGEFRLRNRNGADVGFQEIGKSVDVRAARGPDCQLAASVDGAGVGKDKTILDELIDVFDVSGEEDAEGRAVFDLLGQLRGRSQAGDDVDFGLTLERGVEIREYVREICGGGYVEVKRSSRRNRLPHQNQEGQY